jgi:hypothetical protein
MSWRIVIPLLILALTSTTHAAPDPASDPVLNAPYRLQVVLHVARHRLLTDVFREQLQRDLQDGLQTVLGDLARVEVVTRHRRLAEVLAQGLQVLDSWKTVSDTKTHFVLVDYTDGGYEVLARQHDGLTGLASPLVRRERTDDRQLVARVAMLLVDRDFGPVGKLLDKPGPTALKLAIYGGALTTDWKRWLGKGEVLALVAMTQGPGGLRGDRVRSALLVVESEPAQGVCVCRLHNRYKLESATEYRALRLGTTSAPLRLRLVSAGESPQPLSGLQVRVSPHGFEAEARDRRASDRDGRALGDPIYHHAAFAMVLSSGQPIAQVPIEILDDRPVTVAVHVNAENDAQAQLKQRRSRWLAQVVESTREISVVIEKLNALRVTEPERARDEADAAVRFLEQSVDRLSRERAELVKLSLDVSDGQLALEGLRRRGDDLRRYLVNLDEAINAKKDPNRKKLLEMIGQAQALEDAADYEKAIATYSEALVKYAQILPPADAAKLEHVRDDLKKRWETKSLAHREARDFIYGPWSTANTAAKMSEQLARAEAAYKTCKDARDALTLRKLALVNNRHAAQLLQLTENASNDDDEVEAKKLAELVKDFKKFAVMVGEDELLKPPAPPK